MRSAFALRIFSGKNIYNFAFVALCGALQTLFSREGSWRKTAFAAPLSAKARRCGLASSPSQSKPNGFASSPKGRAKSTPGNFALEPETVSLPHKPSPQGGKAYALPETFSLLLKLQQRALDLGSPFGGAGAGAPERACPPPKNRKSASLLALTH